jgi:hypothetical protein
MIKEAVMTVHKQVVALAIYRGVESSRKSRAAVPVRQIARTAIEETKSDPSMLEEAMAVACRMAIARGLAIEFTRAEEVMALA